MATKITYQGEELCPNLIKDGDPTESGVQYYFVDGLRIIDYCAVPPRMTKGDIFNCYNHHEYRGEYHSAKIGAQYDGESLETSIATAEQNMRQYYDSAPWREDWREYGDSDCKQS